MSDVTKILKAIDDGDTQAAEELLPLVYDELRRLAAQKLSSEKPGQTLQATALVHEAYIRLIGPTDQGWDSRGHFFAAAAEAMRRILVESARRKAREKHGGNSQRVELDDDIAAISGAERLLVIHEALEKLACEDSQVAGLVKLRYFAGFSISEAAEVLGISRTIAYEHWAYARAWLRCEIEQQD